MNIAFTFKNFEPSDHLKKYARRRFEKLGRFFGKASGLDVQVALTVDKFRHKCDVRVAGEGLQLSATEQTEEMYSSIDLVLDKLEAQVKKHVSRAKEQQRKARNNANVDIFTYHLAANEPLEDIKEVKNIQWFQPKPIHLDDAVLDIDAKQLEFLVFLNADNNRVNVLYKRRNGDYGLIDPIV